MRKFYLTLVTLIACHMTWAQSENCSGATLLTNGACVSGSPGLTQNIVGCTGNADDDVWYRFVASATSHSITVTGSATFDPVLQFFSGVCSSLISGGCVDNTLSGQSESMVASGLTIGTTYYIRVYHYYAGSGSGTFTICLNNPPAAPANDNCVSAINLAVNASCIQTSGTTYGATTQTLYPGCAGTANDDVWYTFTATNYTQTIQVTGSSAMDAVLEVFSGTCGSLTSLYCIDNTFSAGTESVVATGLNPGSTYYFRVYDYYATAGSSFSVCVSGNNIVVGTQPNDEPCNAIQFPPVTADCNYATYSNVGATLTSTVTTPSPAGCTGGTGGFGATTKDVWFSITVPASGNLCITPQPNLTGTTVVTDGVMALYGGSCSSLSLLACSDDADGTGGIYNYPGTANDFLPYLNVTGLTPGATVYLRYWGWSGASGSFGICVQAPTNDNCANALYICDINGYSASTSPAYTPDRPGTGTGQMYGNNETSAGVNQPDGTNTGGIFGYYPFPGTTPGPYSAPALDVTIDNNSWIRFTAASPTIALRVSVFDCWENGAGNQGVQMQIFSGSNCNNFAPVSSFREGIGTYTVNATGLTVGNDYYLMVDGWGGNICNYNIQAIAGVAFPDITAVPGSLCPGQTSTLTAPSGATGYTWEPTGETTQSIVVAPGTTMTYTCYVGGVCGYKQTLVKTVNLLTVPSVSINSGSAISTCGTQTITLTGSGASTYIWSTGSTASSTTVAPSGSITYSVIGTAANGCTNTAITNVTVNTIPTLLSSGTNTICNGANTNLTVSGASTYTWAPTGSLSASTGTNVIATPTIGTNYTITGTAANGCTNTATYSVTVNSKPTVSATATSTTICNGSSVTLNGTGASTYTWTGGVSDGVAFTPTATTTYTVIGTAANTCTNSATKTISVTPLPTVGTSATNSVVCIGTLVTLNGTGASTYTWTGGITNGVAFTPSTTTTYTVTGAASGCTNTAVRTITVNALPNVSSTASNSVVCNGQSVTLNGAGASTYTWTGGITNGVAFIPGSTTTYTVTGTDGNGCVNTSVRTITVNSIPTSTVSSSGTITCITNTINLNSTLAGANYTWTAPAGSSVSGANNQNAIGQGGGTYTLNVLSNAGCTYSTTLSASVNTLAPTASATNGTLTCAITSTVLTGGPASGVSYNWSGPGISGTYTNATATVTAAGNYSLVTTSLTNGCTSSVTAVGVVVNNLTTPTVSAGSNQTITCAAPSVTLTGSATSGSGLSWSNGASTNTTTVGGSGIYTLTATNLTTGCSATSTVQVAPSAGTPNGVVGAVSNSITCTNTNVAISITSTSTPISILWTGPGISGANNTNTINVTLGGTYTVSLTNTLSLCSQAYQVVVPTNTTPVIASASIAPSASITCGTTTLALSASPNAANYNYTWSGPGVVSGGNTSAPVVNAGGNYTVTITNTITGCSGVTGTTNIAVPVNTTVPVANLSASSLTTTCGNPTATTSVTASSGANTTYTWTAPATGTISNTGISNPVLGGSGIFTVVVTNTVNGCSSLPTTLTVTADANTPTYTLSANSLTINCTQSAPGLTLSTTPTPVNYSWTPVPASGGNSATPTFTAPGSYSCVITNPTNSCSTSVSAVSVTQNTIAPIASSSVSSSITCSTGSISINASVTPANNVTYNWSGPAVLSGSTTLNPVVGLGGDYVIAMTNTVNGCTSTYTVSVPSNTALPTLSLSATAYTTTCATPNATLSAGSDADPASTYSWTAPATGTISNNNINNPVVGGSGVFTVAVTNTVNGCVSLTQTVSITPDQNIPTFTLQANTLEITCNTPAPTASISSNIGGVTFSWSPTPASGGNSATPGFTVAGNYTCTITNPANNCSNNLALVSVNNNTNIPVISITPDASVTCSSTTLALTSTVNPAAVTYTWSGSGITSAINTTSVTVSNAGTYSLSVTDTNNGCTSTASTSVGTNTTAPGLSTSSSGTVLSCATTSLNLNATSSNGTPVWTLPGGGTASNPVTAVTPGDYVASVTDSNNGCIASQTISVSGNTIAPDANAGAATLMPCNTSSVSLTGSSTTTDVVTYNWQGPNAGSITSGSNTASPLVNAPGVYTLTVTNTANGCLATATVNVISNNVTAAFSADPMSGEAPLTVNLTNESTGASSYTWNFGNGQTSTLTDPNTVFNTAGTYTVVLIASSATCADTTVKIITVDEGFTLEIPNVFTPNGDGANDAFHIKMSGVKSAEGYIYNRWGQLLYSWDAKNVSWDGKASNGENCPDATYYYIIKVIDNNDKEHLSPGFVLIIR